VMNHQRVGPKEKIKRGQIKLTEARGGLGGAYRLPTLSSVGASLPPPCFRFHTALIEPDVRMAAAMLLISRRAGVLANNRLLPPHSAIPHSGPIQNGRQTATLRSQREELFSLIDFLRNPDRLHKN